MCYGINTYVLQKLFRVFNISFCSSRLKNLVVASELLILLFLFSESLFLTYKINVFKIIGSHSSSSEELVSFWATTLIYRCVRLCTSSQLFYGSSGPKFIISRCLWLRKNYLQWMQDMISYPLTILIISGQIQVPFCFLAFFSKPYFSSLILHI